MIRSKVSPGQDGLQLLENSLVTGAALVALITALGPVSAAFNPAVTLVERALGALGNRAALVLVAAQVVGCCTGVVLANLMFERSAVDLSTHPRSGSGLWLGEVVATFGLVLVVFGTVRAGRGQWCERRFDRWFDCWWFDGRCAGERAGHGLRQRDR